MAARQIVVLALLGGAAGVGWVLLGRQAGRVARGPISEPNPRAIAPVETWAGSVRHVLSPSAPKRLLLDTAFPDLPVRLLWFEGRPTQPMSDGAVTTDGAGGVLRFDRRLRATWVRLQADGWDISSVAPVGGGGWWLGARTGELLQADAEGHLVAFARDRAGRPARTIQVPYQYPEIAAAPGGDDIWVFRSAEQFGFGWYPNSAPPILLRVNRHGRVADSIGPALVPEHVLLTDLANAGRVATAGDTVWYAPFIRDQVIAFGPRGDTLWVAGRALPHGQRPPRFEVVAGKPVLDYAPVNLGIAVGSGGRLYILSTGDSAITSGRLDVFDRSTGRLLRTADLPTPLPTLAADTEGRVYVLDPSRLLTGVAPRARPEFAAFDLERMGGGRATIAGLRGKVTLINFWASWCTPCRAEMPALDSLARSIGDPDFAFLTINEDVKLENAKQFITEFAFDFPVLLGRGKMRGRYHYLGLPFTVVLDRSGRVVQRWFGYSGPEQIGALRGMIAGELRARRAPDSPFTQLSRRVHPALTR